MRGLSKKLVCSIVSILLILVCIPDFKVYAKASGIPGKSTLQHNQWGEDVDGNYDITVSMWYGNNGTSFKLYERFGIKGEYKVVEEGTVSDNSPNAQIFVIPITGREEKGIYYYYVELINEFGSTSSDPISLQVGVGEHSNIVLEGIDDIKSEYQFTIDQGSNNIKLYNKKKENSSFSVSTNNKTVVDAKIINGNTLSVTGLDSGRGSLKITDLSTGEIRFVGVRVRDKNGKNPGLPKYVSLGQVSEDSKNDLDFWKDFSDDDKNKRVDIRYIYLNDGPINGWRKSTTEEGGRAKRYIAESLKLGMIPYFVFYNIPDTAEDYNINLRHINDKEYMAGYYKDLQFFLDIIDEYAKDELVGIVLEPDFLGYMMQQSGKMPYEIEAIGVEAAYESGILERGVDPDFSNTVTGICESINYIISKSKSNITFGWQFNTWGYAKQGVPGQGLMHATEYMGFEKGREFIKNAAIETANYYMDAGILSYGADFISIDKYGLDGAYQPGAAEDPEKSNWLWNADLWNNYLYYTKTLHETTKKPVTLWQLPVGRLNQSLEPNPYNGGLFPELPNITGKYEDSAPTFFFGDSFKPGSQKRFEYFSRNESNDSKTKVNGDIITYGSHMEEAKNAGVTTLLFGAGVGMSTDCVGNPPADNYWWITKAQRYYKNPVMLDIKEENFDIHDINKDGKVDIIDLSLVASKYNANKSDIKYDADYDINNNGIIDLYDIVAVAKKI